MGRRFRDVRSREIVESDNKKPMWSIEGLHVVIPKDGNNIPDFSNNIDKKSIFVDEFPGIDSDLSNKREFGESIFVDEFPGIKKYEEK